MEKENSGLNVGDKRGVQVVIAPFGADLETNYAVSDLFIQHYQGTAFQIQMLKGLSFFAKTLSIPLESFEHSNWDRKFNAPIVIKEAHLRRIIHAVYEALGDKYSFNPNKIGLNKFRLLPMSGPLDLINYLCQEVLPKVYPNFLSMIASNDYCGRVGVFVAKNITSANDIEVLKSRFQCVYPIEVSKKKKDEETNTLSLYAPVDFSSISAFDTLKSKTPSAVAETCKLIELDVEERLKGNDVPMMLYPVDSTGVRSDSSKSVTVGKVVFEKGQKGYSNDEIIV